MSVAVYNAAKLSQFYSRKMDRLLDASTLAPPHVGGRNAFYIWRQSVSKIAEYYGVSNGYLCPNCRAFTQDFNLFLSNHASHASDFKFSKSAMLQELGQPSTPYHIWNESIDKQQAYYKFRGQYLCPTCRILVRDFDSFVEQHKHHAGAFEKKKTSYAPPPPLINNAHSTQTTTCMKRKSTTNLFKLSTQLKKCHTVHELDLSTLQFTSVSNVIAQHRDEIVKLLQQDENVKIQTFVNCQFVRTVGGEEEYKEWFISNKALVFSDTFLANSGHVLDEKITRYEAHGSNWRIAKLLSLGFTVIKVSSLCRLAGRSFIPSPPELAKSKAVVNVHNNDDMCFLYSILAVLKYEVIQSNFRYRSAKYQDYLHELNYKVEDMPMRICNISKFEKANPTLRINVLKYNEVGNDESDVDVDVYKNPQFDIIYRSANTTTACHPVNLLVLERGTRFHYVAITNLNRLLNTHKGIRIRNIWCTSCLLGFRLQQGFEKHMPTCGQIQASAFTMPEEKQLTFTDWHKTISPQFVVYADFESVLEPTSDTSKPQKHMPCAAGYVILPSNTYKSFFGESCIVEFLQSLEECSLEVYNWYKENAHQPMDQLSSEEEALFQNAEKCYLCNKVFDDANDKVRDHDHFTGKYLGPACNKCNLVRRITKPCLPVVFHNLRGYDMHHILKHAMSRFSHWSITCIPQSSEKFLSLRAYIKNGATLVFLDSLQFLNASLASLVSSIECEQLCLTNGLDDIPDKLKLGKGVFPYSFAKSINDLNTCNTVPPRCAFESDADHETVMEAWCLLKCCTLKDYMMAYLKLDVFLLADVFESFRKTALTEDALDPLNFYSIPGLSYASALKSLPCPLDLLQDPTMYEFFESGVRGGMTFVNRHRVTASEDTQLLYIDINNLYGWALSQKLPCSNFEWIFDQSQLHQLIETLPALDCISSDVGYVFDVDIEIPIHLHDKLDQLPIAPVSQAPPGSSRGKVKKLLLTHLPKTHYVIHFALLQFFLRLGAVVTRVHRLVKFRQDYIFKRYVDYNTEKRAQATNKFDKDFYKLKNNSLYGKTVENIRKRSNIRLCNTEKKLVAYASKPTFKKSIVIDDDLVAALMCKDVICLNKPIYVGQAVLDLSKLRMYKLHYEELERYRQEFNCELNIVAGDTDSFFLQCVNVSVPGQLLPAMMRDDLLDTSNYPADHPLHSKRLANVVGKFKDEGAGITQFTDWVFLRPKLYSLQSSDTSEVSKAKGVNLRQVTLTHAQYVRELEEDCVEPLYVKQQRIGSLNHQLYTFHNSKLALSRHDDKRHWLDRYTSCAYGHCKLLQFFLSCILFNQFFSLLDMINENEETMLEASMENVSCFIFYCIMLFFHLYNMLLLFYISEMLERSGLNNKLCVCVYVCKYHYNFLLTRLVVFF